MQQKPIQYNKQCTWHEHILQENKNVSAEISYFQLLEESLEIHIPVINFKLQIRFLKKWEREDGGFWKKFCNSINGFVFWPQNLYTPVTLAIEVFLCLLFDSLGQFHTGYRDFLLIRNISNNNAYYME